MGRLRMGSRWGLDWWPCHLVWQLDWGEPVSETAYCQKLSLRPPCCGSFVTPPNLSTRTTQPRNIGQPGSPLGPPYGTPPPPPPLWIDLLKPPTRQTHSTNVVETCQQVESIQVSAPPPPHLPAVFLLNAMTG